MMGTMGISGVVGTIGTTGTSGVIGTIGTVGTSGVVGTTGTPGVVGVEGMTGVIGVFGVFGTVVARPPPPRKGIPTRGNSHGHQSGDVAAASTGGAMYAGGGAVAFVSSTQSHSPEIGESSVTAAGAGPGAAGRPASGLITLNLGTDFATAFGII
jgi:hypothetical protein